MTAELEPAVLVWLLPLSAYILGTIPSGVLIARRFTATDIRTAGSGNVGATNVARLAGVLPGLLTLLADGLKGTAAVALVRWLVPAAELSVSLAAVAAVCGHMFPFHSGFRGGKGVATAAGAFLVVAPLAVMTAAAGFILTATVSRRVSAGSLTAAVLLVPAVAWRTHALADTLCALAAALLIGLRHRSNIARLIRGTEPPFRLGKHKQ